MNNNNEMVIIYGTAWCGDCKRTRAFLDRNQVAYQWVDIDRNPDACAFVEKVNHGCRSVPTILFPNGDVLVEPSTSQLVNRFGAPAVQS